MFEMTLSAKELLVLAAEMDAEHFYGVRDPFWGMTSEEIRAEYPKHMDALEKKGYLSMGFDDNIVIDDAVKKMVQICSNAVKYISVNAISFGAKQPSAVLYFGADECVRLVSNDVDVRLTTLLPNEVADLVMETAVSACKACEERTEYISLGQDTLSAAAANEDTVACTTLKQNGCSDAMAKLLTAGLKKTASYCTISITNLEKRTLEGFNLVYDEENMLLLEPEAETIDRWIIRWQTNKALRQELTAKL